MFSAGGQNLEPGNVDPNVAAGLAGQPSADTQSCRPLAQAFGLAVDRVVDRQRSADKQANIEQAIDSHRVIGQAVGILVERHRLLPGQAFDRLKEASQNRNLKLRDVAARVIQTGAEPEDA